MRSRSPLALAMLTGMLVASNGCVEALPERYPLNPEAQNVEIVNDPPNREVYESAGEVSATVIGREVDQAFRQAFNHLRNQAAAKGASFVAVDDVSSRAAWDFSGRTIVSVVGTAYRPK